MQAARTAKTRIYMNRHIIAFKITDTRKTATLLVLTVTMLRIAPSENISPKNTITNNASAANMVSRTIARSSLTEPQLAMDTSYSFVLP